MEFPAATPATVGKGEGEGTGVMRDLRGVFSGTQREEGTARAREEGEGTIVADGGLKRSERGRGSRWKTRDGLGRRGRGRERNDGAGGPKG